MEKNQGEKSRDRKLRLLVVDDEPDIRLMLDLFFRNAGHEVISLPSATAALDAARHERFDAVVSDVGMPGMDGYELAAALRKLPTYATVPLIAMTGLVEHRDRHQALQAGFNHHLTKPINLNALLKIITKLCDKL